MVRRDPLNERGPAPPGGRKPTVKRVAPQLPTSLFTLRPYEEYEKIWAAGVADLDHAISRIKAYIEIGLPGANTGDLEELADRLSKLREDAHE